jgi:hypothetical protein
VISIQQAACTALQTYLAGQLSGVSVFDRWPDAQVKLADRRVTILHTGTPQRELFDPKRVKQVNIDASTATYTYEVASLSCDVQLDVWARSDVVRDDLRSRLEIALTRGIGATASSIVGYFDPIRQGTLVALASGWEGTADFYFEATLKVDSSPTKHESEYRSMFVGKLYCVLTVEAVSPRMARIHFQQKINEAAAYDVATIDASGVTYT